ncbi:hypothetical protein PENSPDRAFT_734679 [Peniophora sp. CONT]|nr:hypothetical protein PENSPDRAFT_734679 [Peniophora sp. CONT]
MEGALILVLSATVTLFLGLGACRALTLTSTTMRSVLRVPAYLFEVGSRPGLWLCFSRLCDSSQYNNERTVGRALTNFGNYGKANKRRAAIPKRADSCAFSLRWGAACARRPQVSFKASHSYLPCRYAPVPIRSSDNREERKDSDEDLATWPFSICRPSTNVSMLKSQDNLETIHPCIADCGRDDRVDGVKHIVTAFVVRLADNRVHLLTEGALFGTGRERPEPRALCGGGGEVQLSEWKWGDRTKSNDRQLSSDIARTYVIIVCWMLLRGLTHAAGHRDDAGYRQNKYASRKSSAGHVATIHRYWASIIGSARYLDSFYALVGSIQEP